MLFRSGHEDVGGHGGCGGFAVGTGDADGVFILLHDGAPGFRTLKNGDALSPWPLVSKAYTVCFLDSSGIKISKILWVSPFPCAKMMGEPSPVFS